MTTRRAVTLIEVLVVAAILLTLVSLLWPAIIAASAAARRDGDIVEQTVEEPQQTYRLYTAKHDGHWWVMHPQCVLHHPDCPCGGRKAEKETQ